jgi:DNA polymerase III epsilon subunit-like protein
MSYIYSLYVIDTETTSLDHDRQDIIEFSAYRMNDNIQKTWRIKATNAEFITEDALRVNGHKREDILHQTQYGREMYGEPSRVLAEIENWMMSDGFMPNERVFIAHNAIFDLLALRNFWKRHGAIDTFPFGDRPLIIDTRQIEIFSDVATNSKTEYYNLGYLVEKYKIGKEKAHTAAGDVLMTKDLVLHHLKKFGK